MISLFDASGKLHHEAFEVVTHKTDKPGDTIHCNIVLQKIIENEDKKQ